MHVPLRRLPGRARQAARLPGLRAAVVDRGVSWCQAVGGSAEHPPDRRTHRYVLRGPSGAVDRGLPGGQAVLPASLLHRSAHAVRCAPGVPRALCPGRRAGADSPSTDRTRVAAGQANAGREPDGRHDRDPWPRDGEPLLRQGVAHRRCRGAGDPGARGRGRRGRDLDRLHVGPRRDARRPRAGTEESVLRRRLASAAHRRAPARYGRLARPRPDRPLGRGGNPARGGGRRAAPGKPGPFAGPHGRGAGAALIAARTSCSARSRPTTRWRATNATN